MTSDIFAEPGVVLAIVGSTELGRDQRMLNIIENVLDRYAPRLVISGGARGVDTAAVEAADRRGIPWEEELAEVQRWEGLVNADGVYLRGFKDRNLVIAKRCTHIVRIASKKSRTYGSGFTRDQAVLLGKDAEEFLIG